MPGTKAVSQNLSPPSLVARSDSENWFLGKVSVTWKDEAKALQDTLRQTSLFQGNKYRVQSMSTSLKPSRLFCSQTDPCFCLHQSPTILGIALSHSAILVTQPWPKSSSFLLTLWLASASPPACLLLSSVSFELRLHPPHSRLNTDNSLCPNILCSSSDSSR